MGKVMLGKYARKLPDDMKEVYTDLIQKDADEDDI